VAFEAGVFLLRKVVADALRSGAPHTHPCLSPVRSLVPNPLQCQSPALRRDPEPTPGVETKTIRLVGAVPPEMWNRLGTKILPK
jgi:hypothetical protein